ncbi:flagellin [Clostridium malenominatum]|uniref:Flagellin n=1 Tax=Clostridium malenominatum TaxID=1539 RepID=A0ABN1IYU3_9CLOT
MRLNHNLSSLSIYREYEKNITKNSKALSRISSGEKITKAGDSPNGIAKSERMRIQIRSMQMAQRNLQDGVSMLQTADGALNSLNSITGRIRELVIQSGGATSEDDKLQIKGEIDQMIQGYEDVVNNTEFNGVKLLNSNGHLLTQMDANVGDTANIPLMDLSPDGNLSNINALDINSNDFIDKALNIVDEVSSNIVDLRSKYGAMTNLFEGELDSLSEFEISVTGSESRIRDADMAEEMMEFSRTGLLIEAGNAMMAQSNKFPQDVLRILENVRSR